MTPAPALATATAPAPTAVNETPAAGRRPRVRDLFCLNCGRMLALVAERDGRLCLQPAKGRARVALQRTQAGLRCAFCAGYPYLDD